MAIALLVAAVVFVVQFIAPQTLGEQVRRRVEKTLRQHYAGFDISIGRGRLDPKVGLIFDDIRIRVPDDRGQRRMFSRPTRDLLEVRQVVVVTSTQLDRLLDKENPFVAKRVIVSGVTAHAWMTDQEQVSLQGLWPPPKLGNSACPRMEIRDAKLVVDAGKQEQQQRSLEVGIARAVVLKQQGTTTFSASGGTTFVDQFEIRATDTGEQTDFRAELTKFHLTPELVGRLPESLRQQAMMVGDLELLLDASFVARMSGDRPFEFLARTTIRDGQFRHPKSSMPLQGIRGLIQFDHNGANVRSCQATWGDARLTIKSNTPAAYRWPLDASFEVTATNLMLDQRLANIIPKQMEGTWNKFIPRGLVDVSRASLDIVDGRVVAAADVICKGVDINFERFPYPVQSITGTFSLRDGRVRSELMSGWIGGQLMNCLFDMPAKPDPTAEKVFSIAMEGPIAIDSELLQALSPRGTETTKLESFIRSLNPIGSIHLRQATLRTDPGGAKHQSAQLSVSDASMRFEKFPYPLYNVGGKIRIDDDEVTLSSFQGSNANGGSITCEGLYRIPPPGQPSAVVDDPARRMLRLDLSASRVALDESLRSSLPRSSRQTWDSLWPSGVLDSLDIELTLDAPRQPLGLSLTGRQFDSGKLGNDALRLHPASVPYRLDLVDGVVRYQNGQVIIDSVRAQHGPSNVSADGSCRRTDGGRWLLTMNVHNGSRLIPDDELINALPVEMRGAMRGLNLRGPVGMSGRTQTLLSNETNPVPIFVWDLDLQLEGNRIGDVGPVHALRGELSVKGERNREGLRAEGQVRIDSMHINELQITQIRGPYQILDDQLSLGQNAVATTGPAPRPIEGRLFDGSFLLNGNVTLSDASFNVEMGLNDAKVPVLLADLGQGKSNLTGTLDANVSLKGLLGTRDLLSGNGKATVEDANLYQLPILYQLLNVLSVTPTEDSAFTNANIDFTLIEDHLVFDDLRLWGSLIALYGSGTLDRRQELDLTFNTRVSPRNTFTRIFRPIIDQRYTLWTVDVRGPLDNPEIERRALDGVGQTLERLFPGMNTGVESKRKDRSAGIGKMFQ